VHIDDTIFYGFVCLNPFLDGKNCKRPFFLDKEAFLKGNLDGDPEEVVMVFARSPTYAEVVEKVRENLKWNDPSYLVELEGRHNVGFGMHLSWKTQCPSTQSNIGLHTRRFCMSRKTRISSCLPPRKLILNKSLT
jgi:hypothetical protein